MEDTDALERFAQQLIETLTHISKMNGADHRKINSLLHVAPDGKKLSDTMGALCSSLGPDIVAAFPSYEVTYRGTKGEMEVDEDKALGVLLLNEVIFTNTHHWEKDWPEKARDSTYLGVVVNDIFAWAVSDAEDINHGDIGDLYRYFEKDPVWGSAIWVIQRRKQLPQKPVLDKIRAAGIWDIDELTKTHELKPNRYDGVSKIVATRKYDTYVTWCKSNNEEARPFDKNWWGGWEEYTKANPDWNNAEWKAADDAAINLWLTENDYPMMKT